MIIEILLSIFIGIVIGYNIGYKNGEKAGYKNSLNSLPLMIKEQSLLNGHCLFCEQREENK